MATLKETFSQQIYDLQALSDKQREENNTLTQQNEELEKKSN